MITANAQTKSLTATDDTLTVGCKGYGAVGIQITGTFSGTVSFKGSINGATFAALTVATFSGTQVTSATSTGQWVASCAGLTAVQAVFSTPTSGSPVLTIQAVPVASGGGGGGAAGSVTQGTDPWIVAGGGTAGTAAAGVVTVQGIASMTPLLATLQTQTDTVMVGGVNIKEINGVTPLMGAGNTGTGSPRVTIASDQAAIPASQSGTWTVQPGNTANTTPWLVSSTPATSGGLSTFMASSADGSTALTSTAQAIKASAGQLYGYYIYNPNSVACYVLLYNVAAASVVVGTTNPQICLTIPALGAANALGANGIVFSNAGWSTAAVMTTAGGTTAPTTALEANFFYA